MDNQSGVSFLIDNIIEEFIHAQSDKVKNNYQVQHTVISFEEISLKMKLELIKKKDSE